MLHIIIYYNPAEYRTSLQETLQWRVISNNSHTKTLNNGLLKHAGESKSQVYTAKQAAQLRAAQNKQEHTDARTLQCTDSKI